MLLAAAIAVLAAANAKAAQSAQFKMVACASSSGAPPYITATNTGSAQHPNGIFDFANNCGGAGGDPPGESAFIRISEHEANGNAGQGAYGQIIFDTPAYVHFKSAGAYTREPNSFNDGWRARFGAIDFSNNWTYLLTQGAGLPNSGTLSPPSSTFGPHLWPFGDYLDFHHLVFELACVRPAGCDRANYNAVDANSFVFILNDDEAPNIYFLAQDSNLMQGRWVSGSQWTPWYVHDNGSGIRNERIRIDGAQRYLVDHQALSHCNATASQTNGEFSRNYQPCPQGPYWHDWTLDTASLSDGAHALQICGQDYGQYRGLNNTGGETCDSRTIHVDNHAPGAPAALQVTSTDPNRYLDHFGARFSLPPDPGSPIAKVHYQVLNAAGSPLGSEQTIAATNPTEIADISGPAQPGDYRLKVWLEDSVGLIGEAATAPIPHDSTPPAAPQDVSVTSPGTARSTQGFDVRWRNIPDAGSPIEAAHYQVLDGTGEVVIDTRTLTANTPQAIADLDTPGGRGSYSMRLWLSDQEGNIGAPVRVPLAYECVRSAVAGGLELSTGLGDQSTNSLVVGQGSASKLSGGLRGIGGPIKGASLCVFSRVITHHDPEFLGIAVSGENGEYTFSLPAGPSREVSVNYRPDQRELRSSTTLLTRVRPTLAIRPKVVKNGHFAYFSGEIPGPDNDGVVVVLQVRSGDGWRAYRRYRTRANGHFTLRYRFTRTTTKTTYETRAQVRTQTGYAFLQGNSRTRQVRVVP